MSDCYYLFVNLLASSHTRVRRGKNQHGVGATEILIGLFETPEWDFSADEITGRITHLTVGSKVMPSEPKEFLFTKIYCQYQGEILLEERQLHRTRCIQS